MYLNLGDYDKLLPLHSTSTKDDNSAEEEPTISMSLIIHLSTLQAALPTISKERRVDNQHIKHLQRNEEGDWTIGGMQRLPAEYLRGNKGARSNEDRCCLSRLHKFLLSFSFLRSSAKLYLFHAIFYLTNSPTCNYLIFKHNKLMYMSSLYAK